MKNLLLIALVPLLGQAQSLKYSAFLAPNFSIYTSEILHPKTVPAIKYWDFGASSGFIIEYYFPKTFSAGATVNYFWTQAELYTPCHCIHPADRTVSIRNLISTHSIDVPISFKLRTNKNENHFTYLRSELGTNWLFYAHRKVEMETNFLGGPKDYIREEISNGSFSLKNSNDNKLGTFVQFGIGQNFLLKGVRFFTELSYKQDINSWIYKTSQTPDGIKEFPIKRQSIHFKIGIGFNRSESELKAK